MERKLRALALKYYDLVVSSEFLRQEVGAVSFYGIGNRQRALHNEMADLAGVSRESIQYICHNALDYENEEEFYIAISDRVAKERKA